MFTISGIFTIKLFKNMTIDSPLPKEMIVNEVLQTSFKLELVISLEVLFDFIRIHKIPLL